ncbi:hypothetical protein RDABS01_029002, partial [Bienertia sinuspersici]
SGVVAFGDGLRARDGQGGGVGVLGWGLEGGWAGGGVGVLGRGVGPWVGHKEIVSRISQKLGVAQAKAHLGKCLYSIYVGSKDWMFNYFIRPTVMATNLLPQGYADKLHKQLTAQIDTLLGLGAKKVMMFGLSHLVAFQI